MQRLRFSRLFLLALCLPALALSWQPGWNLHTNGVNVVDIALSGDAAWIATHDGLVYHRPATGEMIRFDTANSGLPGNLVQEIAVDPFGRVWAATPQGLARYDGADWTTWDSTSPGYPFRPGDREIAAMTSDLWGDLWIAARQGFVAQFDGVTWTIHGTAAGYSRGIARDIETDANGDVWVATTKGLAHWDWGAWTVVSRSNEPVPIENFLALDIDATGAVWTLSGQTIARYDGTQWWVPEVNTYVSDPRTQVLYDLSADPWGSVWVATKQGLLHLDVDAVTRQSVQDAGNDIAVVETDGEGNTWIGRLQSSLRMYDGSNWRDIALPGTNPALASNDIRQVEVARDGSVWVETDRIARFHDGIWTRFDSTNSPLPTGAMIAADTANGAVWFGNLDGLYRFRDGAWSVWDTSSGLPLRGIRGLGVDRQGSVWMWGQAPTVGNGLVRFDGTSWRTFDATDHPAVDGEITTIAFDAANRAWIGQGDTLLRYDGSTWTVFDRTTAPFPYDHFGVPNPDIYSIAFDRKDVAWIGFSHNSWRSPLCGLLRYDGTTWTLYNDTTSAIDARLVDRVAIAPDDAPWLITGSGNPRFRWPAPRELRRFDGTGWTSFVPRDFGLSEEPTWISDLAFHRDGSLWVATAFGLASYRPATMP